LRRTRLDVDSTHDPLLIEQRIRLAALHFPLLSTVLLDIRPHRCSARLGRAAPHGRGVAALQRELLLEKRDVGGLARAKVTERALDASVLARGRGRGARGELAAPAGRLLADGALAVESLLGIGDEGNLFWQL